MSLSSRYGTRKYCSLPYTSFKAFPRPLVENLQPSAWKSRRLQRNPSDVQSTTYRGVNSMPLCIASFLFTTTLRWCSSTTGQGRLPMLQSLRLSCVALPGRSPTWATVWLEADLSYMIRFPCELQRGFVTVSLIYTLSPSYVADTRARL